YAGVLGALMRGHGYVPLNPNFPVARTREMLDRSGAGTVIVGEEAAEQLPEVLAGIDREVLVVAPDAEDADLLPADAWQPAPADPGAIAYVLFTSGSTGRPKGVMVAHRNATHFIDAITDEYGFGTDDRFSQTCELTFDVSVSELFGAWSCGASLHC